MIETVTGVETPVYNQIDKKALRRWLHHTLAPEEGYAALLCLRIPATGYSALTAMIDVAVSSNGMQDEISLVLRLEKPGQHVFPDGGIPRQAAMMSALHRAGIPAPRVLAVERDTSVLGGQFLIMERLQGHSLPQSPNYHLAGLLVDTPESRRGDLWLGAVESIAKINALDRHAGFDFLDRPDMGEPGLDQYLTWLRGWRDETLGDQAHALIDPAIDWLFRERPAISHVDVLWGDSNPGNLLFRDDGTVAAVLDFEAAALGPAEIDLGWWLFMDEMLTQGVSRLPGFPGRNEQIAHYQAILGREVADLAYFELLAAVRIALVMARLAQILIDTGRLPPTNRVAFNNPAAAGLAARMGLDLDVTGDDYQAFIEAMNRR